MRRIARIRLAFDEGPKGRPGKISKWFQMPGCARYPLHNMILQFWYIVHTAM